MQPHCCAAFKANVAIVALGCDETLAAFAEKLEVHPDQITQWKTQLLEDAVSVFAKATERQGGGPYLKELRARTRRQALEIDFLAVALGRMGDVRATR